MDPGAKGDTAFRCHPGMWFLHKSLWPVQGVCTIQTVSGKCAPECSQASCTWQSTDSITLCLRVPMSTRCDVYHRLSAWLLSPAWLSRGSGSLRQRAGTLPHSEGKAGRWGLCRLAVQGSGCFLAQVLHVHTQVSPLPGTGW